MMKVLMVAKVTKVAKAPLKRMNGTNNRFFTVSPGFSESVEYAVSLIAAICFFNLTQYVCKEACFNHCWSLI